MSTHAIFQRGADVRGGGGGDVRLPIIGLILLNNPKFIEMNNGLNFK